MSFIMRIAMSTLCEVKLLMNRYWIEWMNEWFLLVNRISVKHNSMQPTSKRYKQSTYLDFNGSWMLLGAGKYSIRWQWLLIYGMCFCLNETSQHITIMTIISLTNDTFQTIKLWALTNIMLDENDSFDFYERNYFFFCR